MKVPVNSLSLFSQPKNGNGQKVVPIKPAKGNGRRPLPPIAKVEFGPYAIADEELFNRMLSLERKRTERTGDPFVLMLLDFEDLGDDISAEKVEEICEAISLAARDTDLAGWYDCPTTIGIIYTTLRQADRHAIQNALVEKTSETLSEFLDTESLRRVIISFHFFPEDFDGRKHSFRGDEKLYPDLEKQAKSKSRYHFLKRALDIAGGIGGLILFSPLFLVVPVLIKLTSRGPVLFRQKRIGRFGKEFHFLKFRTMYINNNPEIHRQYVKDLIEQKEKAAAGDKSKAVFKIVHDPRITSIGRWLRKTSMDELPQFLNVLKGDMSIVGPRPPIPYEVAEYRYWHRRRIIEVKPGITGLWQVYGRSRTTFDEMVRLDLRYVREQSILLDLKIILRTPLVLISGEGAY